MACAVSACVDQLPTSSDPVQDDESKYELDGRPNGPRVRGTWVVSAFAVANGIEVVAHQPFQGTVFDTQDDGTVVGTALFPDPTAFIACGCFAFIEYLFPGFATRYNWFVVGGAEVNPLKAPPIGELGSGKPVIYDLVSQRTLDLPLPPGARSAIVTGLGRFRRPPVVGTANYLNGETKAVLWTFDGGTRTYSATLLADAGPGTSSAALNSHAAANLIVGSVDGHPATWTFDNPTSFVSYSSINGEFRDVNASGVLVGMSSTSGFMIDGGTTTPIAMEPTAINDRGYVVGFAPAGATLRLRTGVLRTLPKPSASYTLSAPTSVTNSGLIGGAAGVAPGFKPTVWGYYPYPDTDHDLVPTDMDNCPDYPNPLQEDANDDFIGDICEPGFPPVPAITVNATQRFEGGAFIFNAGTSTDPKGRPLTFSWDFGDGTYATGPTARKVYTDEGSGTYTVTLTADNRVETADATMDVTVRNARPNLTVILAANPFTTGSPLQVDLEIDDAGVNDTFTYTIEWGDGVIESGPCSTNPCSVSVFHTYAVTGLLPFKARVNDGVISRHFAVGLQID